MGLTGPTVLPELDLLMESIHLKVLLGLPMTAMTYLIDE